MGAAPTTAPAMQIIQIFDDVLPNPHAVRAAALAMPRRSVTFGDDTFHGIAEQATIDLLAALDALVPSFTPTLSFTRQSPRGQVEPNFIHSDAMMGDLTAIYYMTPVDVAGDGTTFWRHRHSGAIDGDWNITVMRNRRLWKPWVRVSAKFNRLVLFKSDLFHSRSLEENHGEGDGARLTHVVFGTLEPPVMWGW